MNISLFFILGFFGDQVVITAIGVENTAAESTETMDEFEPRRKARIHERQAERGVQTDSSAGQENSDELNSIEEPDSPESGVDSDAPLSDEESGRTEAERGVQTDSSAGQENSDDLNSIEGSDSPESGVDSDDHVTHEESDRTGDGNNQSDTFNEESTDLGSEREKAAEPGDETALTAGRETGEGSERQTEALEKSSNDVTDDLSGRSPNVVSSSSQAADPANEDISATRESDKPIKDSGEESKSVAESRDSELGNGREDIGPDSIQAETPSPNAVNENPQVNEPEPISFATDGAEKKFNSEPKHVGIAPHVQKEVKPVSVESQYFEQKMLNVERNRLVNDPLTRIFDELFGDSLEWFPSHGDKSGSNDKFSILVNCNNLQDDSDYKVNLVTTLCPFLRNNANNPCGTIRRASYQFDDGKKLCSSDCAPHLNAVLEAYRRREILIHRHDMAVFRDIANQFLLQYAGICRLGSSPRLET